MSDDVHKSHGPVAIVLLKARSEMRMSKRVASPAIAALLVALSGPAWSQAVNTDGLSETRISRLSVSDRFEAGEFGAPQDAVRPETAEAMASLRDPAEGYVYYVVPCDTPGAIRAGSPAALLPEAIDAEVAAHPAQAVCVVLVDESRTDGAPLLYSYDSPYRYPGGYPNHYRPSRYSRTYVGSASVGYYGSRRYGASRYGRYSRYGYGTGYYGPYPDGPYASTPYSNNAGPYGPYPYGSVYSGTYGYGGYPYGASYFGVTHLGTGHFGGRRFGSYGYRGHRFYGPSYSVPNGRTNRGRATRRGRRY